MFLETIKILIKRISFVRCVHNKIAYRKWLRSGKPVPPPHIVKQMAINEYANKFHLPIFVETGTFHGDMVYAVRNLFRKIYSIELDTELCEKAKSRFTKYKHITILEGDSSKVLPVILNQIKEPCLFWLDGHYSGDGTAKSVKETPISEEMGYISDHSTKKHVILIDDAREFKGQNDYPTLEELKELMLKKYPAYTFEIEDDIIRIHSHFTSLST